MDTKNLKEARFLELVADNRQLICKVCYMYASDTDHFNDLYQEVLANMWQGLDSFRGEARLSTWIYRMAINSCITFYRRNRRHIEGARPLSEVLEMPDDDGERQKQIELMYSMISDLPAMDKALIMMWLDEHSYDEIAAVTGISRNNVASRLRRIKLKLIEKGAQ